MLPGIFFTFWRLAEIITLIPAVGMLSWFVHGYTENNTLTPLAVLIIFIISVLALVWAVGTLLFYGMTKHNGFFVAFIDILFVGAFIAAVYELRGIATADCGNFRNSGIYQGLGPFGAGGVATGNGYAQNLSKNCSMLKASFAFAIMNILFFFFTSFLSLWIHHKHRNDDPYANRNVKTRSGGGHRVVEERYVRRSGSRSRYGNETGYAPSHRPRSSSHHHHHGSRRSSHSRAVI